VWPHSTGALPTAVCACSLALHSLPALVTQVQIVNGVSEVHGATRKVVRSYDALQQIILKGNKRRVMDKSGDVGSIAGMVAVCFPEFMPGAFVSAGSALQAEEPRSHTVLTLYISITDNDLSDGNESRSSKLHLVDLAGEMGTWRG
jgi:hypothetical protein